MKKIQNKENGLKSNYRSLIIKITVILVLFLVVIGGLFF